MSKLESYPDIPTLVAIEEDMAPTFHGVSTALTRGIVDNVLRVKVVFCAESPSVGLVLYERQLRFYLDPWN